jgi:hypothetical protein
MKPFNRFIQPAFLEGVIKVKFSADSGVIDQKVVGGLTIKMRKPVIKKGLQKQLKQKPGVEPLKQ